MQLLQSNVFINALIASSCFSILYVAVHLNPADNNMPAVAVKPLQDHVAASSQLYLDSAVDSATHNSVFGNVFVSAGGNAAIESIGDVQVDGVVAADNVKIRDGPGLAELLTAWRHMASSTCPNTPACVHGVMLLGDGKCECLCEDHWGVEPDCSVHDCYGHGVYDSSSGCVCNHPYVASTNCRLQKCGTGEYSETCFYVKAEDQITSDTVHCSARGWYDVANSRCICTAIGALGSQCESMCGTPMPSDCTERDDWGHDLAPTAGRKWGVCGGAFTLETPYVRHVVALVCTEAESDQECLDLWEREHVYCCAPGATCGRTAGICTPTDAACCIRQSSASACRNAGCAWCSDAVCAATALVDMDSRCQQPLIDGNITSTIHSNLWVVWPSSCLDTDCAFNSRRLYLQTYYEYCADGDSVRYRELLRNMTVSDCLSEARARINNVSWPQLWANPIYTAGNVRIQSTTVIGTACSKEMYLSRRETLGSRVGAMAYWVCAEAADAHLTSFRFVPAFDAVARYPTHVQTWLIAGTPIYITASDLYGGVYCMGGTQSSEARLFQITGRSDMANAVLFYQTSFVAMSSQCGVFRMGRGTTGLRDTTMTLYMDVNATSGSDSKMYDAIWNLFGVVVDYAIL